MELEIAIAQALWAHAPDAIVVVGDDGIVLRANPQVAMLGYTPEELVGQPVEALVPAALRGQHASQREGYQTAPRARLMSAGTSLSALAKDGTEVPVDIALTPVVANGRRMVVGVIRDVRERRLFEERLRYLGFHDPLCGLYNRTWFDEHLARLERSRARPIALIVIDVDGLKRVNDAEGHAAGDALLKRAAGRIRGAVRAEDAVARIGGDEFAVTLEGVEQVEAERVAARMAERGDGVSLSVGVGVAGVGESVFTALSAADARMYEHKRSRGRGR